MASLVGCSQGGCRELDMTEQLSMCGDTLNYILVYYNIINIRILEICMQNYLLISSLQ